MRAGPEFTSQQWLNGLLPEVDSARSVLASADRLLRQDGALERDLDAGFAVYSTGAERLMKLALGTAAVSKGEGWPEKMGSTRADWDHALNEMEERLRSELCEAFASGDWWAETDAAKLDLHRRQRSCLGSGGSHVEELCRLKPMPPP